MMEARSKNRIRELRKEKGLRQSDLARKVGIFQSELSEIETGVRKPNVYLAERIARALGVSLDEFFDLKNHIFTIMLRKIKKKSIIIGIPNQWRTLLRAGFQSVLELSIIWL